MCINEREIPFSGLENVQKGSTYMYDAVPAAVFAQPAAVLDETSRPSPRSPILIMSLWFSRRLA